MQFFAEEEKLFTSKAKSIREQKCKIPQSHGQTSFGKIEMGFLFFLRTNKKNNFKVKIEKWLQKIINNHVLIFL